MGELVSDFVAEIDVDMSPDGSIWKFDPDIEVLVLLLLPLETLDSIDTPDVSPDENPFDPLYPGACRDGGGVNVLASGDALYG